MGTLVLYAQGAVIGAGREAIEDAAVVVVDGVIAAIGRRADIPAPEGPVKTHDYRDQWVMPGMIDTHVHLTLPGDGRGQDFVEERSDLDLVLVAERNASRALAAGVTTLRDVGSRGRTVMALRDAINRGERIGPRLIVSGPPITITGGHCHYFGGEADGVDGVRRQARTVIKSGADVVKVIGSGGGTRNVNHGRPSFTLEEMRAAVEEAHRFSRRTTVHATCTEAVETAIRAGVDMIEHSAFWENGPHDPVHHFREDLAEEMVERGIFVCPTLQASYGAIRELREREEAGLLTDHERAQLDRRLALFEATMETAGRMYKMGVRQVAGTDCGYDINPFGSGYVTGLELAAEAGMPHWAVIEHATSLAAAALALEDRIGALRVGLEADMVVVPDNPLEDLGVLRRPTAVYRAGRLVAAEGESEDGH